MRPLMAKGHNFTQIREDLRHHSDAHWPKMGTLGTWNVLTNNLFYSLPHANPQTPEALPLWFIMPYTGLLILQ